MTRHATSPVAGQLISRLVAPLMRRLLGYKGKAQAGRRRAAAPD